MITFTKYRSAFLRLILETTNTEFHFLRSSLNSLILPHIMSPKTTPFHLNPIIQQIIDVFQNRGSDAYGSEPVTQLEHALQTGALALEANAKDSLVVAAFLHDIGHIIDDTILPEDDTVNLDDRHEECIHPWLLEHFGEAIASPVRLHVPAKRYLCSVDSAYASILSPTSLKSFHDQGGVMSPEELREFEADPFYKDALELRRWDDQAKSKGLSTPAIHFFVPYITRTLIK